MEMTDLYKADLTNNANLVGGRIGNVFYYSRYIMIYIVLEMISESLSLAAMVAASNLTSETRCVPAN